MSRFFMLEVVNSGAAWSCDCGKSTSMTSNHHGLRRWWSLWRVYREGHQHAKDNGHIVRFTLWAESYGKRKGLH